MTTRKIFYAWQSWVAAATTRNAIEDALKRATASLRREPDGLHVVIDRDTKGLSGSPHIPDAIREKIRMSDAFVADITPVAQLQVDGTDHHVPNPNVLFEVGCAVESLGWAKVVLVMNRAYGDIRCLPFDLDKHKVVRFDLPERGPTEPEDTFHARRKTARDRLAGTMTSAFQSMEMMRNPTLAIVSLSGLFFHGAVQESSDDEWVLRLVSPIGDHGLEALEVSSRLAGRQDQYVAISRPGLARELLKAPHLTNTGNELLARLSLGPAPPRVSAHLIGPSLDIERLGRGGGRTPGGVVDVPRVLEQTLSMAVGEWFLDRHAGSYISAYANDFEYAMLSDFIALEIARLANVPSERGKAPRFAFIRRVERVVLPAVRSDSDWLPVSLVLDVEGVGKWTGSTKIFIQDRGR